MLLIIVNRLRARMFLISGDGLMFWTKLNSRTQPRRSLVFTKGVNSNMVTEAISTVKAPIFKFLNLELAQDITVRF
jgi:hypothetical protein